MGDKSKITIKTIASLLGISTSTVSRALQGNPRIGLHTREKVNKLAKELKYVSNSAAQFLKNKKTSAVGVVVPNLNEEYFSLMISGIEDVLSPLGIQTVVSQSRDSLEREKKAVEHFLKARVDGLIISLSAGTNEYEHFTTMSSYGIPIVFCDRTPKNFPSFKVKSEVKNGLMMAMKFLYEKGIKRIALLNGPAYLASSDERLDAYLSAIDAMGLETSPQFIKSTNLSKEDTIEKMFELLDLQEKPDALISFNDYVALDAIKAFKSKGFVSNVDMTFIGFGNLPISSYIEDGPVASVEQFPYQIGYNSAQLLVDVFGDLAMDFKEILVDSELKLRS